MPQPGDVRIARLAPAATPLGQLQRGRGEGFLAALSMRRSDARRLHGAERRAAERLQEAVAVDESRPQLMAERAIVGYQVDHDARAR